MKKDLLAETIAVYNELGAKYADQVAHVKLPQIQELIEMLPNNAHVLDVGCAAGRDSAILRDAGFSVVGIDLAESFLNLAEERVLGVEFKHMDARELSFKQGTFDGILAHAILLNLDRSEILKTLNGFWRVLKSEGYCCVGVKEGKGEKFIGETLVDNLKRREIYFEKFEMEDLLISAGFKIKKSYIYGDKLGRSAVKWLYVFSQKKCD